MIKQLIFALATLCVAFALKQNVHNGIILSRKIVGKMNQCSIEGTCVSHTFKKVYRSLVDEDLTQDLTLKFAVTIPAATCDQEIMRLSDPQSPDYGKWMTREEVKQLMSNPKATTMVENWLKSNNVDYETSFDGSFIKATASLSVWSELLETSFSEFVSTNNVKVFRAETASLPLPVGNYVEFIGDLTTLPFDKIKPFMGALSGEKKRQSGNNVSPQLLNTYYGIKNNTIGHRSLDTGATASLFESLGQEFSPQDLTTFDTNMKVPPQTVAKVIGVNTPNSCATNPNNCAEANLDVQWFTAIAQECPLTYWSISPQGDIFLDWIDKVAADPHPPLVSSISYGGPESEMQESIVKRFNTEVCKMGLRGLTVMIASGDDGVCGAGCRGNPSACGFNPGYPAACPYVTAVGATQGPESSQPEVTCASDTGGLITSGGGFSGVFPRPSWQAKLVDSYLANGPNMPPKSMFDSTGRGYPDVAVMGHNYVIVINGNSYVGSGTSASSPLFAAMVTLSVDARITAGKSAGVGFINPALYQFGDTAGVFHDITSGENNCAAGNAPSETCCQYGFNATVGWDAATGLGSPHFEVMKGKFLSLP